MGAFTYLVGCFQGSLEALRALQQPTHFTDFVIAHSHLTVFGTFVVRAIAGTVYTWPRLAGDAPLWSFRAGNWGFWLITVGISAMGLGAHRPGPAAGLHAHGARGVDGLDERHPAVLVGAHLHRHLDGHRDLACSCYTLMHTSLPRAGGPARQRRR